MIFAIGSILLSDVCRKTTDVSASAKAPSGDGPKRGEVSEDKSSGRKKAYLHEEVVDPRLIVLREFSVAVGRDTEEEGTPRES